MLWWTLNFDAAHMEYTQYVWHMLCVLRSTYFELTFTFFHVSSLSLFLTPMLENLNVFSWTEQAYLLFHLKKYICQQCSENTNILLITITVVLFISIMNWRCIQTTYNHIYRNYTSDYNKYGCLGQNIKLCKTLNVY